MEIEEEENDFPLPSSSSRNSIILSFSNQDSHLLLPQILEQDEDPPPFYLDYHFKMKKNQKRKEKEKKKKTKKKEKKKKK